MIQCPDIETEAGGGFASVVSDLDRLDGGELTERFRELELLQRRTSVEMAAITGEVDRRGVYLDDGHRGLSGWLRAHGSFAQGTVTRHKRLARLVADLPEVGDDLHAGRIGVEQAAELARAHSNPRCGDELGRVVGLLLDHANRFGYNDFKACVTRWETQADRDGAHRDRGEAVQARRAAVIASLGGVDISATGGTALQAAEMVAILEAFVEAEFRRDLTEREANPDAGTENGFARTDRQRRFDAVLAVFRTANNSPGADTPAAATVNVLTDQYSFEWQLARHDLADEPRDLTDPGPVRSRCETSPGSPLLPEDVVLAALGGWVRRVVVDSAGVVVDLGHRRRCFTGAAAEAARLLATTCEDDGCEVPEVWSQIDHIHEWHDHGRTDQNNGAVRCGHHNRNKHRQRIRTHRDYLGKLHTQRSDGTWITPVGADPPTEADFLTDADVDGLVRRRIEELHRL